MSRTFGGISVHVPRIVKSDNVGMLQTFQHFRFLPKSFALILRQFFLLKNLTTKVVKMIKFIGARCNLTRKILYSRFFSCKKCRVFIALDSLSFDSLQKIMYSSFSIKATEKEDRCKLTPTVRTASVRKESAIK